MTIGGKGVCAFWFGLSIQLAMLLTGGPAKAVEVSLDTSGARAVLEALGDPNLSHADALSVASLPSNLMMVRKVKDRYPEASPQRFSDELLAAARGSTLSGPSMFRFSPLAKKRREVLASLDAVEAEQSATAAWISSRIDRFAPPGRLPALRGYLIAGGTATGFTFGDTDFYLNIADFAGDPAAVKFVAAHELFHALQGGVAKARQQTWPGYEDDAFAKLKTPKARENYMVNAYLGDLMIEGTATFVGDPQMMTGEGAETTAERQRYDRAMARPSGLTDLLDVGLTALTAATPVSYEKAYGIAFYGPNQPLYYLGYTMSKALSAKYGDRRIGLAITQSGCAFAEAYLDLTNEDTSLLRLGDATVRLIKKDCPVSAPTETAVKPR